MANSLPTNDGGIVLAHFLGHNGRIHGEATITRLAEDHYYLLSGAATQHRDRDHLMLNIAQGDDVTVKDITEKFGTLMLAGPKARDVLSTVCDADLSNDAFGWLTGHEVSVSGHTVRLLRVNYVGELGWEIHAPMACLSAIYDTLWQTGKSSGIADFGAYAMNSLRLEKAYKGWGTELTNEITMLEADMERFINWDNADFMGHAAT